VPVAEEGGAVQTPPEKTVGPGKPSQFAIGPELRIGRMLEGWEEPAIERLADSSTITGCHIEYLDGLDDAYPNVIS